MKKIGAKNWILIVVIGFAGQVAWVVENNWFNTFVYTITTNPKPISIMVAVSAIVATLTTFLMGTLSDRVGKRKPFICIGYILWGLSTAAFPLSKYAPMISFQIALVIILDAVMTFFGSTANDSNFNAWTTDISDESNRGILSMVLTLLPAVATVVTTAISGIVIQKYGYMVFFISLGVIVSLIGIIFGGFMLKDSPDLKKKSKEESSNFFKQLIEVFKPSSIKENKSLFIIFIALFVFNSAIQIFMPYLLIYMNNYLKIELDKIGVYAAIAFILAAVIILPFVKIIDKGHAVFAATIGTLISTVSLIWFSFLKSGMLPIILAATVIAAGVIIVTMAITAFIKNMMPEGSRGQFEGVRMIFNVMLPMIIGPAIGSYLNIKYGTPFKDGTIPSPLIFSVAGICCLIALIPLFIALKSEKKAKEPAESK